MNPRDEFDLNLDSPDQISEKVAKLKEYGQFLRGKALQLEERERELNEKELKLKLYRKNILMSVREHLADTVGYEQKVKILEKYRDILQFVAKDIQDDLDDIMG